MNHLRRHREMLPVAFFFWGNRSMKLLAALLLVALTASAQTYPRWFLFQDQVPCARSVVIVQRAPSMYKDSAIALAFRTGCDLLAKYNTVVIKGGQAFWATEDGVHSMGAQYTETYDEDLGDFFKSKLKVLDAFVDDQKTIVLSGDSGACGMSDQLREKFDVRSIKRPEWVDGLPNTKGFYFNVGTSEEYYYESSSWQRAEHNALMGLARSIRSKVVSMQKKNQIEGQDVFNEDLDVELKNVQIAARWRDVKNKVFYVLAKVKR